MRKMNFKYVIMAVAALTLGLTSCSNDDEVGGERDNGKETYMKVSFSFPSSGTSGTRATDDTNATDAEAAVKTVDVFIYTASGSYVSHTTLAAGDFTQGTSTAAGDYYEATKKIKTSTGAKSVLVGINLPTTIATGLEYKSLNDAQTASQTLTRAQMTTLASGIPMFSTAAATTTLVADDTDPANTVTATVQRMVAKVTVEKSPSMVQSGVDGEIGALEFAINNFNERSFLVQSAAPDYKDPKWASGSYVAGEFSNAAVAADWKSVVTTVANVKTLDAHYAAENTSADHKMGEITRATVRATFMPNVITVYTNGTDKTGGYKTADRVSDVGIVAPQTFYTVTASLSSGTAYFYDSAIADDYAADNSATKEIHTDGICYWNLFLNKGTTNKGKQWDVLRNEFLRCQITRIVAPGNPTPDVDPGVTPDEETNIFTDIEILNWNTPVLADYELEP